MNEIVTRVLNSQLERLEEEINRKRDKLSDLVLSTLSVSEQMDRLTTERRAIRDALEASA